MPLGQDSVSTRLRSRGSTGWVLGGRRAAAAVTLAILAPVPVTGQDSLPRFETAPGTDAIHLTGVPMHADTLREGVEDVAVKAAEEMAESTAAVARPQRSKARTYAGAGLIVAGLFMPVYVPCPDCHLQSGRFSPRGAAAAAGFIVTGFLLATVWNEVPSAAPSPSIDFTVTPDRVQVGKTLGW